jgi:hypothetical protein
MGLLSLAAQAFTIRRTMRDLQRYEAALKQPQATQHNVLFEQLRREAETGFGRDHRFRDIRTLADFRRQVPIRGYEGHEPYLLRVQQGETEALFHRQRVRMFALTSGTTSARKLIPVTDRVLDNYRRLWTAWGFLAYSAHPTLFNHARLTLVSDWDEFRTSSGVPCGSISGFTAHLQNWIVRRGYVLPGAAGKLTDSATKSYLAWRLGLTRSVGSWLSPNPSTLLNLAKFGEQHAEALIRDVCDGTCDSRFPLPASLRQLVQRQLRPQPQRAWQLYQILERTNGFKPKDVWPMLGLLGCWTGGSMSVYLRSFPEYFGNAAIRDLGLLASEGRMTFPIADGTPSGVLEIVSGFFEFIPIEEADSPQPTVLEAHELLEGRDYFILLTNASGLYRYHIRDVVRCTGWQHGTPLLAFLNKGRGISSLTGEKLSEFQVVQAVAAALESLGGNLDTFSLGPIWDDPAPYYTVFVEPTSAFPVDRFPELATAIDAELQAANIEYAAKRSSLRLGPVAISPLTPGTWSQWDRDRLAAAGGTAEQYKHPCLITDLETAAALHRQSQPVPGAVPLTIP